MVIHFSVDTSVNIPATVNDFVKHLSGGFTIRDVFLASDIDEVKQFILNYPTILGKLRDTSVDRQKLSSLNHPLIRGRDNKKEEVLKNLDGTFVEYISIITLPYLERENQVNLSIVGDTLYSFDSQGIVVSFVNVERLIRYLWQGLPLLAIDGVHVGTSVPHPVEGLINPKILTDKPIYQADAYTAIRQADLGVKEIVGQLWRENREVSPLAKEESNRYDFPIMPVMGTAFLWNLIICNGNRPMPTPEETIPDYLLQRKTDCWFPTYTYRSDRIYDITNNNDNLLPSEEIRKEIEDGHCFSIKVAGALRASLYHLKPNKPLIIEPHSYSGFSHEFLNQYVGKSLQPQDWLPLAKKENALRPLVSVLDVQKLDRDGYWTTTQEEAERFYQGFLGELKSHWQELPFLKGIPESMNDVYGYGGGILTRLAQVMKLASDYGNTDFDSIKAFYKKNILTVEINRLLVQLSEFEDVSSITEEVYLQRCQIVANGFMAGIKGMLYSIRE